MADRAKIKKEVVQVIDMLSPLDLASMEDNAVEGVKINVTTGFDSSMKRALCIPLTKIARRNGLSKSRPISQTETSALKTVKGAIDLTSAAADGLPFDGE
ncbi:hypothetical protein H8K33_12975 [Undibacterium amnicola]|uniref:Uncharacterized protein n=1 Tax=Undibacterium amnicola TaxID=1834038 RepID=A0ABR6XSJ0_9BURK|nr:hypothetical protein [Undibacterium amnicola]MBC3832412.1 hypothetical protein [Undibacterium amnicola]